MALSESSASQPALYINRSFSDFDDLSSVTKAWDLDLLQLDRGPFRGHMFQVGSSRVLFSAARFGRMLLQRGSAPPGVRTFGIAGRDDVRFRWRGGAVRTNSLTTFPANGELHANSEPDFRVYTISVNEEHLAAIANADDLPGIDEFVGRGEILDCDPTAMGCLRATLRRIHAWAATDIEALHRHALWDELEYDVPSMLLQLSASSRGISPVPGHRPTAHLVRAATELVEAHARPLARVDELASQLDVSPLRLRRAFRAEVGVSPKRYLDALRLRGVRRDLVRDPTISQVKAAALRWGFRHLGQFSLDYKRQFGERPSDTLRQAR